MKMKVIFVLLLILLLVGAAVADAKSSSRGGRSSGSGSKSFSINPSLSGAKDAAQCRLDSPKNLDNWLFPIMPHENYSVEFVHVSVRMLRARINLIYLNHYECKCIPRRRNKRPVGGAAWNYLVRMVDK